MPAVFPAFAQTQQPFLFATIVVHGSTAVVAITGNDSTGALTVVAGRLAIPAENAVFFRTLW